MGEEAKKKQEKGFRMVYLSAMALLLAAIIVCSWLGLRQMNTDNVKESAPITSLPPRPTYIWPTDRPTQPGVSEESTEPGATEEPTEPSEAVDPDEVLFKLSEHSNPIYLVGSAAQAMMQTEDYGFVSDFLGKYQGKGRLDMSVPVELRYEVEHLPQGVQILQSRFLVYERGTLVRTAEATDGGQMVQVDLLKTGTTYDYRVQILLSNGTEHILNGQFQTAVSPRILSIEGLANVRDFGGWTGLGGKIIRQGVMYRGSTMDGLEKPAFKLTEKGLEQMKSILGIRVDMDLRGAGEDALGDDVPHIYIGAYQYSICFEDRGKQAIARVFAQLADPNNYPMYLHCTYGADRTGTVCYLLGAILGMSDRDLRLEYDLSALYYWYICTPDMDEFVSKIAEYPGIDTKEKVENYLLSAGVTMEQIESIRDIFLED